MGAPPANGTAKEGKPAAPSRVAVYSAVVATLAFVLGLANLFYTQLRAADLRMVVGGNGQFAAGWNGQLGLLTPVTIWNAGSRAGIVAAIDARLTYLRTGRTLVYRVDSYYRVEGDRRARAEEASAEVVKGGDIIRRNLILVEVPGQAGTFEGYAPGAYRLVLRYRADPGAAWRALPPRVVAIDAEGSRALANRFGPGFAQWPFADPGAPAG